MSSPRVPLAASHTTDPEDPAVSGADHGHDLVEGAAVPPVVFGLQDAAEVRLRAFARSVATGVYDPNSPIGNGYTLESVARELESQRKEIDEVMQHVGKGLALLQRMGEAMRPHVRETHAAALVPPATIRDLFAAYEGYFREVEEAYIGDQCGDPMVDRSVPGDR